MFLSMGFMKLATKTTEQATYHRGDLSSIDYFSANTSLFIFVVSCDFKDYGAAQQLQMLLLS